MKVLHLTRDLLPLSRGGVSVAVAGLVDAMAIEGLDQAVISFDDWRPSRGRPDRSLVCEERRANGVPVYRLGWQGEVHGAVVWALAQGATAIHLHDGMFWQVAEILSRRLAVPLVYSIHVAQWVNDRLRGISEETLSLRGQLEALERCDVIHVPSQSVADDLLRYLPRHEDKAMAVLPFGIAAHGPARRAQKIQKERPASQEVLYVGRFSDIKGTGDLLSATEFILAARPQATIHVVGGNPGSPKSARRWWRKATVGLSARDAITWHGWLSGQELSQRYAMADVVVVPSHYETFGLVAAEAALHGAPLCLADCPALTGFWSHDEDALFFAAGDAQALANQVVCLLADRNRARLLAQAAHGKVTTRLAWRGLASSWSDVYG